MRIRHRRQLFTAAIVAAFILLFAVSECQCYESKKAAFTKGMKLAMGGYFQDARDEFKKTLDADPFYKPAKMNMDTALAVLHEKIKKESGVAIFKGADYADQMLFDEANNEFTKAILSDPGYAQTYVRRGLTYMYKGLYSQSIADFDKAIGICEAPGGFGVEDSGKASTLADAYYNRGYVNELKGKYEEAIYDYGKASELDPTNVQAFYKKGVLSAARNEFAQAVSDFSGALKVNPKFQEAFSARGKVLRLTERYDEALSDLSKAIELDKNDVDALLEHGMANVAKGYTDLALVDFNRAVKDRRDYAKVYYYRGNYYYDLNQFEPAMADYVKTLELDPDFVSAYFNKAITSEKTMSLDRKEKAIEAYKDFIKRAPPRYGIYINEAKERLQELES